MNRVLLADDNGSLRSALALLLTTRLEVCVVGEVGTLEELLAEVAKLQPEAVVLDWSCPEAVAQAEAANADAVINKSDPREMLLRAFQAR